MADTKKTSMQFMIPASGRISSDFGMRMHPTLGVQKFHSGIDIAPGNKRYDNPIVAAADGEVTFVGKRGGYGNVIVIKHSDGYESVYAHNTRNYVKEGQPVRMGDTIGLVGTTGRSTGIHLHFEIRKDGKPLDPAEYLPGKVVEQAWVKSNPASVRAKRDADILLAENGISPNAKVTEGVTDASGLIPKEERSSRTGKAAAYAFSQGDAFSALTILSEGVGKGEAFYYDPASNNGKHKTIVNTHPGISLRFQSDKTLRSMFDNTSIANLESEVFNVVKSGRDISPAMKSARLTYADYPKMFNAVRDYYEDVAHSAMVRAVKTNPHAKEWLRKGMSAEEVANQAINNLPETSYAVLQHAAYKQGNLNSNTMKKLAQAAISAGLDVDNQQKHLEAGAAHINYVYDSAKAKGIVDIRVMTLHRTFFVSGEKIHPELAMKIATDQQMSEGEAVMVGKIAKEAGLEAQMKDNRLVIPNDSPELQAAKENGDKLIFNDKASSIPQKVMKTQYEPVNAPSTPATAPPSVFVAPTAAPKQEAPKAKPTAPAPDVKQQTIDPYGAAFGIVD